MANAVSHFAIYADDLERARKFYGAVFGWRFEPWGPPDYFKVFTGPSEGAGVTEGALSRRELKPGARGLHAYRCSISVASIDEAVAAIEAEGGRLRSAVVAIPGICKVIEFEDTEGNVVCAVEYEPADPRWAARDRALSGQPRLFRVILPAADIDASVAFYRCLLDDDGERVSSGRHYFSCGGVILAVVDPRADGDDRVPRSNFDHLYLAVAELQAYHERAGKLGALDPVMGSIETRPWGERSFYLRDPFGNPLCFVSEKTVFVGRAAPGER